jgi:hypothetical protein
VGAGPKAQELQAKVSTMQEAAATRENGEGMKEELAD